MGGALDVHRFYGFFFHKYWTTENYDDYNNTKEEKLFFYEERENDIKKLNENLNIKFYYSIDHKNCDLKCEYGYVSVFTKKEYFGSYSGCYNFPNIYSAIVVNKHTDKFNEISNFKTEINEEMKNAILQFEEVFEIKREWNWNTGFSII